MLIKDVNPSADSYLIVMRIYAIHVVSIVDYLRHYLILILELCL
jgi:hypothetical protein